MFYKKNTAPVLDEDLFQNPTSEYKGQPFWCWNCKVTKEMIQKQIDIYEEMGVGGFTLHCRTGLETPYLSDAFMDLVKYANEYAKQKGMHLYLYDEDRYASGAAGGMVTENVRYRQRSMFLSQKPQPELDMLRKEYEAKIDAGEKPKGYYLTSYWVLLDEDGCLKEHWQLSKERALELAAEVEEKKKHTSEEYEGAFGKVWHAYVKIAKESPWFNDQTYIDVFNKEAVEKFIEVTHERYYQELADDFGTTIPSIFTDEPQMAGKFAFATPEDNRDATLSYTDDMNQTYKKEFGISLLAVVPEILWELPDGQISEHRYHYHDHLAERFAQSFPDTIAKWCEEHNIGLTGHYMSERSLYSQTLALSEAMRLYRSMQYPGIDILCDAKELTTAKQAVSVARQYGREGVSSELYGVTHWDADFKTYKLQGDWQAALGITMRVHHLTFMSMEGEAKRDWPASIGYQSPWYPKYSYVEDHFARLNTVLTRGKALVNVAVLHPIESYWISYGPNSQTQTVREQLDENYENLMQWLLYGTIDFDLVSESLLPGQCPNLPDNNRISIGEMQYQTILVPSLLTIRSTTLERLEAFAKAGGRVVFAGNIPKLVDAKPSERAVQLAKECTCIQFNRAELLEALQADRLVEIRDDKGKYSTNLMYQMRQDGDRKWLFICHVNRKNNVLDKREKYYITIKGLHKITLYNTINGEISPYEAKAIEGNTMIKAHMYAEDSLLFLLEEGEPQSVPAGISYSYVCRKLEKPNAFSLSEPNALLLDYAEYKFDDGEWQEKKEILVIDNEFRKALGLPRRQDHFTQPYRIKDEPITHKVTLRYRFDSEIEVHHACYAMERPENAVITLNGEPVSTTADGWYVDEIIRKVSLPSIRKGTNELLVEIPFGRKVNLEWSYILGDFGVEAYADYAHIVEKPQSLRFGSVVSQRLPFYTGNITYTVQFQADTNYDSAILEVPHFRAPVMEVFIDGESKGIIAYAPHKLELGTVVSQGEHKLDIVMYGNRYNGFGTLHNANDEFRWYGPDSYRTSGSQWTDEYRFRPMGILSALKLHLGIQK